MLRDCLEFIPHIKEVFRKGFCGYRSRIDTDPLSDSNKVRGGEESDIIRNAM